jgi:LytS/YehU family sensor histidine kinase
MAGKSIGTNGTRSGSSSGFGITNLLYVYELLRRTKTHPRRMEEKLIFSIFAAEATYFLFEISTLPFTGDFDFSVRTGDVAISSTGR